MKRHWLKSIVVGSLALLLMGCLYLLSPIYVLLHRPIVLSQGDNSFIQLQKSTSASVFVRDLKHRGWITSERTLLALIRLNRLSHQLQSGIYQVKPHESVWQLVRRVASGDVLKQSFQIIEGTTQRQVSEQLQKAAFLIYENSDWLQVDAKNPEGLLLADTYQYNAGSKASELLKRAHDNLTRYLDRCWASRSPHLPYHSAYDLLIVASILEKETADNEEKRLISGVIVNRLRKNMPLQMDPTVIYALGAAYQGKLTHELMQTDSPYNTYRYRGLPPTPIAMVGKDAIDAAAHPQPSDYLYFVARGDGKHRFSVTYEEQKKSITQFLRTNK